MVKKYLLDTHALIWWWIEPNKLSKFAMQAISNPTNVIYVSSASIWEIATKHRKGKLNDVDDILQNFAKLIKDDDFNTLAITWQHAKLSGELAHSHNDPFDRMLVAQSQLENLTLISCDAVMKDFDIKLLW